MRDQESQSLIDCPGCDGTGQAIEGETIKNYKYKTCKLCFGVGQIENYEMERAEQRINYDDIKTPLA